MGVGGKLVGRGVEMSFTIRVQIAPGSMFQDAFRSIQDVHMYILR